MFQLTNITNHFLYFAALYQGFAISVSERARQSSYCCFVVRILARLPLLTSSQRLVPLRLSSIKNGVAQALFTSHFLVPGD